MDRIIALDGDDTLWLTEPFYQTAHERLVRLLEPHVDGERLRSALYDTEMRNLELFGYGAKGFVLSMIETAIELSARRVSASEIESIIELGKDLISHPVQLIDGAAEVVDALSRSYDLLLITKGDLFDQEGKVARSGLAASFAHVHIVSNKDVATYRRIVERHSIPASDFVMVGDSLRSDVLPVLELGGHAIHVPNAAEWQHEAAQAKPPTSGRYHSVGSIEGVPAKLREILSSTVQRR